MICFQVLESTPSSKGPKLLKSKDTRVETGTFDHTEMDWSQPSASSTSKVEKNKSVDNDSFDWGAPVLSTTADTGETLPY